MKKLQLFLLAMAFCAGSMVQAMNTPTTSFSNEVYELLEDLPVEIEEEQLINLVITLNEENEIVVLTVDSEDPFLNSIIKKRLNYKKVSSTLDASVSEYNLPIRIKP